ncbi:hypothetical protein ABZX77_47480 [Streptomyces sp. NPDC004237]|uniref:hypothetical protein n=1 Tax=Streptomyces sp. NPDC004237 TaxID=3154455 RepID=UPI0033BA567F
MDSNHPRPLQEVASAAAHAAHSVAYLITAAGPGRHQITAAALPRSGRPITARARFTLIDDGTDAALYTDRSSAVAEAVVVAFLGAGGSILLHSSTPTGEESVRGWVIEGLTLRPLTADQVQRAYREASGTAPAVTFLTAFPVPPPTTA